MSDKALSNSSIFSLKDKLEIEQIIINNKIKNVVSFVNNNDLNLNKFGKASIDKTQKYYEFEYIPSDYNKINDRVIKVWSRILKKVKNSKLKIIRSSKFG